MWTYTYLFQDDSRGAGSIISRKRVDDDEVSTQYKHITAVSSLQVPSALSNPRLEQDDDSIVYPASPAAGTWQIA